MRRRLAELGLLEAKVQELEAQNQNAEAALRTGQTETAELRSRLSELEARNLQLSETASGQQAALGFRESEVESLRQRVSELEPLGARLAEWETRYRTTVSEKNLEIERLEGERRDLELKYRTAEAGRSGQEQEIEQLRQRITELELMARLGGDADDSGRTRPRPVTLPHLTFVESSAPLPAHAEAPADSAPRASERQAKPASEAVVTDSPVGTDHRAAADGSAHYDDLKLIHGVGPVLEKMLHKLGIHWFRQVALWTEADIEQIDAQLEHFHGRIRREDWIGSAKEEPLKKYGEEL